VILKVLVHMASLVVARGVGLHTRYSSCRDSKQMVTGSPLKHSLSYPYYTPCTLTNIYFTEFQYITLNNILNFFIAHSSFLLMPIAIM